MQNDKVCPICGGLVVFAHKHMPKHTYDIELCLHCGHVEIVGWDYEKIIV